MSPGCEPEVRRGRARVDAVDPDPEGARLFVGDRGAVDAERVDVLALLQLRHDRLRGVGRDREELLGALAREVEAGVVHADDLRVLRDERAARVAGLDVRVLLDDVVDVGGRRDVLGLCLRDDALGERELGIVERVARREDVDARLDVAVEPLEERVSVALDVDHREVRALGHAEHSRRLGLSRAVDEHLDRRGARDHVVVRDRDARRVDDEPAARAGVARLPDLGVADRAVGLDADHCARGVVDRGDRLARVGQGRVGAVGAVRRDARASRALVVVTPAEHDDAADHERDHSDDRADDDPDLLATATATRGRRRCVGGRGRRGRHAASPGRHTGRSGRSGDRRPGGRRRRGRRRRRGWGRHDAWLCGVVARHGPLLMPSGETVER